jgi:hypothetical protein
MELDINLFSAVRLFIVIIISIVLVHFYRTGRKSQAIGGVVFVAFILVTSPIAFDGANTVEVRKEYAMKTIESRLDAMPEKIKTKHDSFDEIIERDKNQTNKEKEEL